MGPTRIAWSPAMTESGLIGTFSADLFAAASSRCRSLSHAVHKSTRNSSSSSISPQQREHLLHCCRRRRRALRPLELLSCWTHRSSLLGRSRLSSSGGTLRAQDLRAKFCVRKRGTTADRALPASSRPPRVAHRSATARGPRATPVRRGAHAGRLSPKHDRVIRKIESRPGHKRFRWRKNGKNFGPLFCPGNRRLAS